MQLPDELVDDVRKRLRRVAGQVQGVERMLGEGRECRDVVTQLRAIHLTGVIWRDGGFAGWSDLSQICGRVRGVVPH